MPPDSVYIADRGVYQSQSETHEFGLAVEIARETLPEERKRLIRLLAEKLVKAMDLEGYDERSEFRRLMQMIPFDFGKGQDLAAYMIGQLTATPEQYAAYLGSVVGALVRRLEELQTVRGWLRFRWVKIRFTWQARWTRITKRWRDEDEEE